MTPLARKEEMRKQLVSCNHARTSSASLWKSQAEQEPHPAALEAWGIGKPTIVPQSWFVPKRLYFPLQSSARSFPSPPTFAFPYNFWCERKQLCRYSHTFSRCRYSAKVELELVELELDEPLMHFKGKIR